MTKADTTATILHRSARKIAALVVWICVLALWHSSALAQQQEAPIRPLTTSYSVGVGTKHILDTYLSPIKHKGTAVSIAGRWQQAMAANPERLVMQFDASAAFAGAANDLGNSLINDVSLRLGWNMQYRYCPIENLQLGAGGGVLIDCGAAYLSRNSNNPVSARLSADITPVASACYNISLGRLRMRLSDRVMIPSLGLFFSPQYGQSYYEIYLGDKSGLVHCGWWGNHFCINNLLCAEFKVGSTWLSLGYEFDYRSSYVNNLNTRFGTHSAVIGITTDWLNVTGRQNINNQ